MKCTKKIKKFNSVFFKKITKNKKTQKITTKTKTHELAIQTLTSYRSLVWAPTCNGAFQTLQILLSLFLSSDPAVLSLSLSLSLLFLSQHEQFYIFFFFTISELFQGPPMASSEERRDEPVKELVHKTEQIQLLGRTTPIILQNDNGLYRLLAICNSLSLSLPGFYFLCL